MHALFRRLAPIGLLIVASCDSPVTLERSAVPAEEPVVQTNTRAKVDAEADADRGVHEAPNEAPQAESPRERGPEQPPGFHFAFTYDRTYVVLRARTEPSWAAGPLRLAQREEPTVVTRAAALPASVALEGATRMVLRRGRELACVAELGRPQLLRRAWPHPLTMTSWDDGDASDAQVAEELWALAPESELLVAEANAIEGECAGARWAHPEGSSPSLGRASISRARVLRAFRRLDGHRTQQRFWEELEEDGPAYWDGLPEADLTITTLRSNGRSFALVSALTELECGEGYGLWAIFEDTKRGLTLVRTERANETPLALIDIEGDGAPEVVLREELIQGDTSAEDAVSVRTPEYDCPC